MTPAEVTTTRCHASCTFLTHVSVMSEGLETVRIVHLGVNNVNKDTQRTCHIIYTLFLYTFIKKKVN